MQRLGVQMAARDPPNSAATVLSLPKTANFCCAALHRWGLWSHDGERGEEEKLIFLMRRHKLTVACTFLPLCMDTETADGLCSACAQLKQSDLLTKGHRFTIGNIEGIVRRAKKCSFCRLCLHAIGSVDNDHISHITMETQFHVTTHFRWSFLWDTREFVTGQIDGIVRGSSSEVPPKFAGHDTPYLLLGTRNRTSFLRDIAPVADPSRPRAKHQFCERPLQPDRVDFNLLREWQRHCNQVHRERCDRPKWLDVQRPQHLRVIDVHKRTVVDAPEICRYAALSYVWGGSGDRFVMKECDLPNSRNKQFKLPQLPRTIEHAMRVTAELGIPYMWVDAVCIAQVPHVNDDKTRHLGQMGRIFKCAEIVIAAAASESASDGIPGVEARDVHNVTGSVAGLTLALTQPAGLESDISPTTWNSRAWTYQELLLARRALVFGRHQAYWLCQCDEWRESVVMEPAEPGTQDFVSRILPSPSRAPERCFSLVAYDLFETEIQEESSVLSAYLQLVSHYTQRRMADPDDGINAIAGLLELLARFDPELWSAMHYGIPEAYFDMLLLWVPVTTCKRPVHWVEPRKIPSWSWAGWFSDTGNGFWWEFSTVSAFGGITIEIVTSLTWYIVDPQGVSIPMAQHPKKKSEWRNREHRIPAGIDTSRVNEAPPAVSANIVNKFPGCLHVLTTTSSFRLGSKLPGYGNNMEGFEPHLEAHALITPSGTFAGTMVLSEDMAAPLLVDKSTIECIFLSYAQGFDLWTDETDKKVKQDSRKELPPRMFEEQFEEGKWSVVNVMWIDRSESGVAERKMVGKILEEVWLSEKPRTEWVLLA